jgi:hypothetical protein
MLAIVHRGALERTLKNSKFLLSATLIALLSACGGGGGGDSTTPAPTTPTTSILTGTAATGAALANAKITVKDSKGASKTATADANGNFSIDVTGMTAPLIIQALSQDGGKILYAISQAIPESNVINVTSITDTLALAALSSGQTPSVVFADPATKLVSVDFAKLKTAQDNLKIALSDYMAKLSVSSTIDLTSTAFSADNTKVDALLDCLSNASGVLSVKASCAGGAAVKAFDPAVNVATAPAKLAAPTEEVLDYPATNLPRINAQIKALSNAWNGTSGDLATVLAATFDANGTYDNGMNRAAFIADQVAKFKAGDRVTLYPGALVGFDKTANTVDMCLVGLTVESGKAAVAESTAATFKKINDVWQVTTNSAAAKAACEKATAPKVTIRAVSQYLAASSGPLVSSLYSSYAVCVGKAPKKALGAVLTDELCAAALASSSTFDVSSWKPASGAVTLVAYIKDVETNKVFSAELGGGAVTLDSTGNLSASDLNICAKDAATGGNSSISCTIDTWNYR